MIPLSEPCLSGREWEYVKDCLDSGWVSSVGAYVNRFEEMLAQHSGAAYAVAATCGTAALHTALMVVGVKPGDEVLVSSLTFIASANSIAYAGAHPVFVDAEPDYWQMDVALVGDFLKNNCEARHGQVFNRATGRRVAAIMPVHILGHPVDMSPLMALAREFGLPVIEDATESLGSLYHGTPTGGIGDIGCFSFNGNKILTTGGGGMIVTNNPAWADRARYLTTQAKKDSVEFIHEEIGYNFRLTNVLAALGCAQMEQITEAVTARRAHAQFYRQALAECDGLQIAPEAPWVTSNCWLSTVALPANRSREDRIRIMQALNAQGIQARPLWQPMHLSPAHEGAQSLGGEVAASLQDRCLSLPSSRSLMPEQRDKVSEAFLSAWHAC